MTAFNIVNPITTCIRQIFMILDIFVYYFLQFNFELFFNIVAFDPIDRDVIFGIISSVQLIIGIFMMFQLVMIILKGIVNPDTITDSKSGGAGNVIMRILVSLVLLALVVPINISNPRNEYERQINNNGILFGTLYSLQYRILSNNTIGRIITQPYLSKYTNREEKKSDKIDSHDFANRFTGTMIRVFYPLSVDEDGNYLCQDGWDEEYYNEDRAPLWIIAQGARKCGADSALETVADNTTWGAAVDTIFGKRYAISMSYLTCTVVGLVMVILVFMMVFGVAKRVFQLVALQVIAPIPIISYMDPKGSKDGAFNSWLKLLGKTYLDLFVRIAVMYFAIVIIQSFMDKYFGSVENIWGTISSTVDNAYTVWYSFMNFFPMIFWEFIVITIGLFLFALEAPKFFKQILGIKDDGKGFFSDFGTAMGLGVAAAGAVGSFNTGRRASYDSDAYNARARMFQKYKEQGMSDADAMKKATDWYNDNKAAVHSGANRAKNVLSGFLHTGTNLATGAAAASESKGNTMAKTMAAFNAMQSRNKKRLDEGNEGQTLFGSISAFSGGLFVGETPYDTMKRGWDEEEEQIKYAEDKLKHDNEVNSIFKAIMDETKAKSPKSLLTSGTINADKAMKPRLAAYNGLRANGAHFSSWVEDVKSGNGVKNWYIDALDPKNKITQDEYEKLTDQQKAYFNKGEAYAEYKYKDDQGVDQVMQIATEDLDIVKNEIDDLNEADFAEKVIAEESGFDNTVITAAAKRYEDITGKNIKAYAFAENKDGSQKTDANGNAIFAYSKMKKKYGIEDARIKEDMANVAKRKQDLADAKNSPQAKIAKRNSEHAGNNGGKK